jgi:hypothetical protein
MSSRKSAWNCELSIERLNRLGYFDMIDYSDALLKHPG